MRYGSEQRRGAEGFALVAVMFVMLILLGVGAALHTTVMSDTAARGGHLRSTAGFYAAEAGINRGMGEYRNIFMNYNVPSGADFNQHNFVLDARTVKYQLANVTGNPFTVIVPAGRLFAGLNATEYRYKADATSELNVGDVEASIGTQFNVDYVPIFQFLAFYQRDLEILPGPDSLFHGPIHTNGSLYLNSENTMTIADCLAGGGAGQCPAAIPIVHITAAGNVFRGRKDADACVGTVRVAKLVDADHNGALDLLTMTCPANGKRVQESSSDLTAWLGSILAKQPVVTVPSPGILARGNGEYWQKADLRLVLNMNAAVGGVFPIQAQNVDGTLNVAQNAAIQQFMVARPGRIFYSDYPTARAATTTCGNASPANGSYCKNTSYVAGPVGGTMAQSKVYACPTTDLNLYLGCADYIANESLGGGLWTARRGGFYNNREGAWSYLLNVNVHDLLAWNRLQGGPLFNPSNDNEGGIVIFLSVAGAGGNVTTPRRGVRVFGSPNLDFSDAMADPTGLTVVSDNAFYVEGTYNNGTGTCSSFGAGHCPKMPAAFMADSINVLSSFWSGQATAGGWTGAGGLSGCRNDCQSFQPLANRPAAATTVYSAYLAGVDDTGIGSYNGGLENYQRFHENWTGQTLTYRGSFVSLGTPSTSNGAWCGTGNACNIYNAPGRNFDFDTDFQNVALLPPITPRFVTVQQILFTENFR